MRVRRRTILWAAAVSTTLGGGCWLQSLATARGQGEWVRATRDDLVVGIEVTGTLRAVRSAILGPPPVPDLWDFKISMVAPEGADVKKGQPVLGFDTTQLSRELEQRRAESESARTEIERRAADLTMRKEKDDLALAEAEARLRRTSLKLEAPEELLGAIERRQSELEADLARKERSLLRERIAFSARAAQEELAALAAQRDFAASRVQQIESHIGQLTVRASREGTVIYIQNWRGDKKKVGDSCWRQERVLEIPDLSEMMAAGEVDEADAGRVAEAQRVRLRLDAHPDVAFAGTVQSVAKTVQRQSPRNPLKILRMDIALDRTDRARMRPGMRFRGLIELERVSKTVVIPLEAVSPGPSGPVAVRRTLFATRRVPLRLGRRNDKQIEILAGLSPGDRVLVQKPDDATGLHQ